jgi:hypothetical protein
LIAGGGAACPRHPDQPASTTCNRCGRFVCGTCLNFSSANQILCTECHQREDGGKASGRAILALVLAIVGFNCLPFLGIPAIILANLELGAIERGESSPKGANIARGARIIGWIEVGVMAVALVFIVLGAGLLPGEFWDGFGEAMKEAGESP